jgi:hypothetical protein
VFASTCRGDCGQAARRVHVRVFDAAQLRFLTCWTACCGPVRAAARTRTVHGSTAEGCPLLYSDRQYECAARLGNIAVLGESGPVSSQIVTYQVDESTVVQFEIEPEEGFRPTGTDEILGRVREAVAPAVEAAKAVLDKVKETRPDQVELKFGVKAGGGANWLVAKAAAEANFEVTLTWSPGTGKSAGGRE